LVFLRSIKNCYEIVFIIFCPGADIFSCQMPADQPFYIWRHISPERWINSGWEYGSLRRSCDYFSWNTPIRCTDQ